MPPFQSWKEEEEEEGEKEEGLFRADAVNEEDPEHRFSIGPAGCRSGKVLSERRITVTGYWNDAPDSRVKYKVHASFKGVLLPRATDKTLLILVILPPSRSLGTPEFGPSQSSQGASGSTF